MTVSVSTSRLFSVSTHESLSSLAHTDIFRCKSGSVVNKQRTKTVSLTSIASKFRSARGGSSDVIFRLIRECFSGYWEIIDTLVQSGGNVDVHSSLP